MQDPATPPETPQPPGPGPDYPAPPGGPDIPMPRPRARHPAAAGPGWPRAWPRTGHPAALAPGARCRHDRLARKEPSDGATAPRSRSRRSDSAAATPRPSPGPGWWSSRMAAAAADCSPRNRFVAEGLRHAGLGTLLFDLLREEEAADRRKVFDIPLLAGRLLRRHRLAGARRRPGDAALPVGYFGASTGAAAALVAAAARPGAVRAVVSRGGRPDLAGPQVLRRVRAPTLLVVGSLDRGAGAQPRGRRRALLCEHRLAVVEGAGHLFEEPGTLEAVVRLAADWFGARLADATTRARHEAGVPAPMVPANARAVRQPRRRRRLAASRRPRPLQAVCSGRRGPRPFPLHGEHGSAVEA